jgi:thioredoxin reductase (NADPH)
VKDGYKIIEMSDGGVVHSKSIIIATGAAYTTLDIDNIEKFTGAGIYYGSASVEAHACKNEVIYIVGGGNSACQAAMYMSKFAKEVNILIRRDALKQTAANYLVENIRKTPNIKIVTLTELTAVEGDKVLERITIRNCKDGEEKTIPAKALFIYIGARPGTSWLTNVVMKNENGFILTGRELMKEKSFHSIWKEDREPFMCEASVPGIFAAGDVRFGATTGISSAVGEGAMAIRFTRKYLQEM